MKQRGGQYVNAKQASLYLEVSRPTFYRRYRKQLKRIRVGGKGLWMYRISDLRAIRDSIEVEVA